MKQALALAALMAGALEIARIVLGDAPVLLVSYGAIALMALWIAATFLWLWSERATPLALGMAFSWAGGGLFAGWWWRDRLVHWPGAAGAPHTAPHGVSLILALFFVGTLLHFAVIHRSFGRRGMGFLWPVVLAVVVSGLGVALAGI